MKNNFDQNSLEDFLQDEVRNHRMYPNDGVWRDINKKLHGDKRWPALTIAAFLIITATVLISLHFSPKPNIFTLKADGTPIIKQTTVAKGNVLDDLTTSTAFTKSKEFKIGNDFPVPSPIPAISSLASTDVTNNINDVAPELFIPVEERNTKAKETLAGLDQKEVASKTSVANTVSETAISNFETTPVIDAIPPAIVENTNTPKVTEPAIAKLSVDEAAEPIIRKREKRKASKFSMSFYAAPSISYRKLYEDKSVLKSNNEGPVGVNQVADVNDIVRHKPATGLEAGLSLLYNVSKTVRIKTGVQFNVRQYSIDAYRSNTELTTIALRNNNRIDTLNTVAVFRNFNGNHSAELHNRYYQLSIPVGLEWQMFGNSKVQWNVAASIQPTYVLNRSAYVLTTNFKNYTENKDMVRKWNMNSNFETFVSFMVGDFKWQIGPQIRYQPYSTFIKQYPIKEHLIDYGFKVGVTTKL